MKINQEGLALIKAFEGLRLDAYVDPVGVWTIGYGHTDDVRQGQRITEDQAEELLMEQLDIFERGVERLVKVPVNENEFSALVSFSYNVGLGALGKSTALQRLNREDRIGAAEALTWWNKGRVDGKLTVLNGLTRRRAAEMALFLKPVFGDAVAIQPAETVEDSGGVKIAEESPDRREKLSESRTIQGAATAGVAGAAATAGAVSEAMKDEPETGATGEAPAPEPTEEPAPEPTEEPTAEAPSAETPETPDTGPEPAEATGDTGTDAPAEAQPEVQPEIQPETEPESAAQPEVPTAAETEPVAGEPLEPADQAPAEIPAETPVDVPVEVPTEPPTEPVPDAAPETGPDLPPEIPAEAPAAATPDDGGGFQDAVNTVGNIFEAFPEIYVVLGVVILFSLAYIVAARFDDWRNGRR